MMTVSLDTGKVTAHVTFGTAQRRRRGGGAAQRPARRARREPPPEPRYREVLESLQVRAEGSEVIWAAGDPPQLIDDAARENRRRDPRGKRSCRATSASSGGRGVRRARGHEPGRLGPRRRGRRGAPRKGARKDHAVAPSYQHASRPADSARRDPPRARTRTARPPFQASSQRGSCAAMPPARGRRDPIGEGSTPAHALQCERANRTGRERGRRRSYRHAPITR
jgi:hypothetical protein